MSDVEGAADTFAEGMLETAGAVKRQHGTRPLEMRIGSSGSGTGLGGIYRECPPDDSACTRAWWSERAQVYGERVTGDVRGTGRHRRGRRSGADRHLAAATSDDDAADARDQVAKSEDAAANLRDREAEARDDAATDRDKGAADPMVPDPPASVLRRRAAADREDAAHDRAGAVDDRGRASRDRKNAHRDRERAARDRAAATETVGELRALLDRAEENPDDMLLIGQAQARLMDERGLVAADAILELCTQAGREQVELRVVAERVVTAIGSG